MFGLGWLSEHVHPTLSSSKGYGHIRKLISSSPAGSYPISKLLLDSDHLPKCAPPLLCCHCDRQFQASALT